MTLVVARKFGNKIITLSDTRLIYPEGSPDVPAKIVHHNPEFGTIKTVFIGPKVALSFAGESYYANFLLNEIYKNIDSMSTERLCKLIFGVHKESKKDNEYQTDFILSIGDDNSDNTILLVFKEGKIENSPSVWIGDKDAFNKFQEEYLSDYVGGSFKKYVDSLGTVICILPVQEGDDGGLSSEFTKLFGAFQLVSQDHALETVGGFTVPCIYSGGRFRYSGFSICHPVGWGRTVSVSKGEGDITAMSLGSAADGAFAFSQGSGSSIAVPIYFPHARYGVLYRRSETLQIEVSKYKNVSVRKYKSLLKKKGINVEFVSFDVSKNQIVKV
jgi:hypothetical protein